MHNSSVDGKELVGWTELLRQERKADPAQSGAITELIMTKASVEVRHPRAASTETSFVYSTLAEHLPYGHFNLDGIFDRCISVSS